MRPAGTLITHLIGRPLIGLYFQRQHMEADFRFSLARLREYTEQVALLGGEDAEQNMVDGRFGALIANFIAVIFRRMRVAAFTQTFGQLSPIIPFIFTAPFYFAGKIELGAMTQTAGAFAQVSQRADLLRQLLHLSGRLQIGGRPPEFVRCRDRRGRGARRRRAGARCRARRRRAIELEDVGSASAGWPAHRRDQGTCAQGWRKRRCCPVRRVPANRRCSARLPASGLMARAASASPRATSHGGAAEALYPDRHVARGRHLSGGAGQLTRDEDIRTALVDARLGELAGELDHEEVWSQRLSGGEQQRLALARALLMQPDWLFLDESTSAVDETLEAEIYAVLARRLPKTTIVSIGHRSTLGGLHHRHLEMTAGRRSLHAARCG